MRADAIIYKYFHATLAYDDDATAHRHVCPRGCRMITIAAVSHTHSMGEEPQELLSETWLEIYKGGKEVIYKFGGRVWLTN